MSSLFSKQSSLHFSTIDLNLICLAVSLCSLFVSINSASINPQLIRWTRQFLVNINFVFFLLLLLGGGGKEDSGKRYLNETKQEKENNKKKRVENDNDSEIIINFNKIIKSGVKVPKWPVLLFAAYEMSHLFFFHFPCLSFGFLFPFLELYRQTSIRECVRHSPLLFCCLYWRGILINLRWNILRINAARYGRHIDNYWPIQRTRDVLYCLSSVKVDANFDSLDDLNDLMTRSMPS